MTKIKSIGMKNFRVFRDYQEFDLTPLTIVTGPNNSGKSSLSRMLSIVSNSLMPRSIFYKSEGEYIEIGTIYIPNSIGNFITNRHQDSKSETIQFSFKAESSIAKQDLNLTLEYELGADPGFGVLKGIIWSAYKGGKIHEFFSLKHKPEKEAKFPNENALYGTWEFDINDISVLRDVLWRSSLTKDRTTEAFSELLIPSKLLFSLNKWDYFNDKVAASMMNDESNEIHNLLMQLQVFSKDDFIDKYIKYEKLKIAESIHLINDSTRYMWDGDECTDQPSEESQSFKGLFGVLSSQIYKTLREYSMNVINSDHADFFEDEFFDIIDDYEQNGLLKDSLLDFLNELPRFIGELLNSIIPFSNAPQHLPSYKIAKPISSMVFIPFERHFKRHVFFESRDEIDNLLINYAKIHNYKPFYFDVGTEENKTILNFINKWLKEFSFGSSIQIEDIKAGSELIGYKFYLIKDERKIPFADNGIGLKHILTLIMHLGVAQYPMKFVIEEPEANLHPAFQSRLADLLVDAYKEFGHSFVVETHSEYFIRRLQFLTANRTINSEDSSIYYFNTPDQAGKDYEQVIKLEIDDDGSLSDEFGPGFFDEATNLKINLLRLKNKMN